MAVAAENIDEARAEEAVNAPLHGFTKNCLPKTSHPSTAL
jgi:hypothetical protein